MSRDTGRASLRHRLYHGETAFDFVGHRRIWFAISFLVVAVGVISLFTQGLNYGIDFKGGNSWEVQAPEVSVSEARDALRPLGLADAKIQIAGGDILRVQARQESPEEQNKVAETLAGLAKVDVNQVSVNDVGPSWGKAVTKKARTALIVFFVIITIYISLRFEWKMAVAAIAAVVHDILVTVVVFDKVEENTRGISGSGRMTYSDIVNLSMNQVLMRSLNTSLVAILPILSVLVIGSGVLGATSLGDFGLALLVGLLTGAYSSIYIASPILAMVKEREPRYRNIRQRVSSRGGTGVLTPAAAATLSVGAEGGGGGAARGPAGRTRPGTKAGPGGVEPDGDDRLVPAGDGAPRTAPPRPRSSGGGRPYSGNRQGAPRPRKKGKKR